ncbi:imidazole glycerol phosphate synthase subunit HisH [bacterium]|nr:imidazole glycerol phosphate synthase subunit HisH [bacterium]
MVTIIDYGMANLGSVRKAFEHVGAIARVSDKPDDLRDTSHIVLPGVGAFGDAMINIRKQGFGEAIREAVQNGIPFLGICLGLQVLFTEGEEKGIHKGLDIFKGRVRLFTEGLVPQIGWNQAHIRREDPLMEGIPDHSYFYFVHSYYVDPAEKENVTIAETDYHIMYASIVGRDRIWGIQFHPEKSQEMGLRILGNFVKVRS